MIANSMTGILAFCIVMVGLVLVSGVSTSIVLPRSPHSISGLARCLLSSPLLLEKFRGMGSTGYPTLRGFLDGWLYKVHSANAGDNVEIHISERLASNDELEMREPEHSSFRPASLSFATRLTVALIFFAITTSLEATLRISKRNDGLGNVPSDSQYLSYLWTVLPTAVFTLISMYCSSADFDTRSLAPFLHLVQGSRFGSSVGLDLINKHPLLLLYGELRSRSFEAMASTLAVTLSSFLTIFSAGLFSGVYFDTTIATQLHVADFVWYGTSASPEGDLPSPSLDVAALILDGNLTYPSFTYENLILPNITFDQDFVTKHTNSSNVEFSAKLTAARPSFANCRLYNSSEVRLNFTSWSDDGIRVLMKPEIGINNIFMGKLQPWSLKVDPFLFGLDQPTLPPNSYFGVGAETVGLNAVGYSQRLWAWGQWASELGNDSLPQVLSVSALACNDSIEIVDVSTVLFGLDLAIDPKRPPIANESSRSTVLVDMLDEGYTDFYQYIRSLSTNMTDRLFDTFFTLLTTSRYAVPTEMIGDESQASVVADAIQFQHLVLATQLIASNRKRMGYPNDADMREQGFEIIPGINDTSSYNVTGSIPSSRHRVVQDELSTRFLQGLLAAALICCLANWYFIHSAGGCRMIPRQPTTIANVAALLADGDLIEFLSARDADLSAPKHTKGDPEQLEECIFRLGWRESGEHSEQVYCIYVSSAR